MIGRGGWKLGTVWSRLGTAGILDCFFLLNIFTQDYPLGWVPLQMRGPARNIAQTYKNNIYTKHDMYNYKNIYTGLYTHE